MADSYELSVLDDVYVVQRLASDAALPDGALSSRGVVSITRTSDALSIIGLESALTGTAPEAPRWRALAVHGPFPLDAVGVMAALSGALARAHLSLLALSTHDTDYLFVRTTELARAVRALRHEGHVVHLHP